MQYNSFEFFLNGFYYILEAKLVTSTGYAILLASEFIANIPGRDFEKQDCERKAFVRLASKIKKYFPRLPICILSDGLVEQTNFVYITNIKQTFENVLKTADGGRLRWKIENQGFNTQKNHGSELEHKFSSVSYTAMQNYYQLLQIAHMINQFVEKSTDFIELLNAYSGQTIKSLWDNLLTFFKTIPYTRDQLLEFLSS
jgi:hypothetical protein